MADESDSYWKVYEEYTKTVRTWFVAYGIGAPVLILGNEKLWKQLSGDGMLATVGLLFVAGGTLQIAIAIVNKWMNWQNFIIEFENRNKDDFHWYDTLTKWLVRQFWIDMLIDVVSLVTFVVGTVYLFLSASQIK